MKKSFGKTIFRMFWENKGKFLANLFIIILSLAIISGLSVLKDSYSKDLSFVYSRLNVADVVIMRGDGSGFTDSQLEIVSNNEYVSSYCVSYTNDQKIDEKVYRFSAFNFSERNASKLELVEGNMPSNDNEVVIEKPNRNTIDYAIGDTINYPLNVGSYSYNIEFKVVGYVKNPMYASIGLEPSFLNEEGDTSISVNSFVYIDTQHLSTTAKMIFNFLPKYYLEISLNKEMDYFDSNYFDYVGKAINSLKTDLSLNSDYTCLDLDSNVSFRLFDENMNKVQLITNIFPFFFIAVCLLTNLITVSRLVAEERSKIGTYVSLGVSEGKIYVKYMLFSFIASVLGCLIGYFLGLVILPPVILPAMETIFYLDNCGLMLLETKSIWISVLLIALLLIMTFVLTYLSLKEKPAELMKYKAPKPGKRILLEKIPFIWNHLSFKYKSSIRNIFRNKKNFYLTMLSIIGSYILLFIGFSLLDVTSHLADDPIYGDIASSMKPISFVIILFALGMCILIVYNLTNMNIQERDRELATLKVLGYLEIECSMYTFREILMTASLALILSLPIGYGVDYAVFKYLDFGTVDYVMWYSYVLSFVIIFALVLAINFMLYPKIKKIDMNNSLKSLE